MSCCCLVVIFVYVTQVNPEEGGGIDWNSEVDRMLVMKMIIKMADINTPTKSYDLHRQWTERITEEFYQQVRRDNDVALDLCTIFSNVTVDHVSISSIPSPLERRRGETKPPSNHLHGPEAPREASSGPALLHPAPCFPSVPGVCRGWHHSWDPGAHRLHLHPRGRHP